MAFQIVVKNTVRERFKPAPRPELWKDAPVWTPETIEVATKDWFKYLSK